VRLFVQVFNAYQKFRDEYDDISVLDTRTFLQGLKLGTHCRLLCWRLRLVPRDLGVGVTISVCGW
jgi:pyruvate carboxylase